MNIYIYIYICIYRRPPGEAGPAACLLARPCLQTPSTFQRQLSTSPSDAPNVNFQVHFCVQIHFCVPAAGTSRETPAFAREKMLTFRSKLTCQKHQTARLPLVSRAFPACLPRPPRQTARHPLP